MNPHNPRATKVSHSSPSSPALRRRQVQLVIEAGSHVGRSFALNAPRVTVGRAEEADIVLDDDRISRVHAELVLDPAGYRVRDLGSTNGTVVNGEPVGEAVLSHGDRIAVGSHELRYIVEDASMPRIYELPES